MHDLLLNVCSVFNGLFREPGFNSRAVHLFFFVIIKNKQPVAEHCGTFSGIPEEYTLAVSRGAYAVLFFPMGRAGERAGCNAEFKRGGCN